MKEAEHQGLVELELEAQPHPSGGEQSCLVESKACPASIATSEAA